MCVTSSLDEHPLLVDWIDTHISNVRLRIVVEADIRVDERNLKTWVKFAWLPHWVKETNASTKVNLRNFQPVLLESNIWITKDSNWLEVLSKLSEQLIVPVWSGHTVSLKISNWRESNSAACCNVWVELQSLSRIVLEDCWGRWKALA